MRKGAHARTMSANDFDQMPARSSHLKARAMPARQDEGKRDENMGFENMEAEACKPFKAEEAPAPSEEAREAEDLAGETERAAEDPAGEEIRSQICELTKARAQLYRLIGSLYFKELDEAGIARLRESSVGELSIGNDEADRGLADMARYLTRAPRNARQELAVDFAGSILAAGSYEERRATPYESVFTSESGLLMQEARDEVYRYYCEAHVEVEPTLQTPEDHLSFECEFMATLAERMAEALCEGNSAQALKLAQTQQAFHREHLLSWIDDYCDCLQSCATTRFYQGVAHLTRGFVAEDALMLADTVEALS